jgi:predicted nucleic acid-binding protein
LLALAEAERAVLVSGDQHLLGLAGAFPIEAPRTFLERLERPPAG